MAHNLLTNVDNGFNTIDYDKVLNSMCYCGTGLPWKMDCVVMAYPCEHMYHEKCFQKVFDTTKICKYCNKTIKRKITILDNDLHHQRFADILSMTFYDNMNYNTPGRFLDSVFDVASFVARLPFANNIQDGKSLCETLLSLNNLTLKVYGLEKTKLEKNKVYICNHVAQIELVILYYLLGTGFLASSIVDGFPLIEKIKQYIPLFTFDRGIKNRKINIVDEMRKFVDERGSICLFPEGMMKHPDSLIRFRTGAFYIGRPLYAIIIKHNDVLSGEYINNFLYKLGAKKDINIEVHILGPYYPPFSEKMIETIRMDMAKIGNMVLSRVSNRDIRD
jgi:hypothetical protein